MVIGVASNALTVVTAGAFQAGGTDICPMVPAPRIAAETSPGPRSAPSDSDLAMLVSGARNAGAMSAGGGAAAAAALPSSGKIPKFFSAPMMPVPIELMLLIEPIVAYQASRPSSKQNSSPTMLGKGIALTISPASRKKGQLGRDRQQQYSDFFQEVSQPVAVGGAGVGGRAADFGALRRQTG